MTTQEQVLSVALDQGDDTETYSDELRQRIANLLPRLKIASGWWVDRAQLSIHAYEVTSGHEVARVWCGDEETWVARDDLGTWVCRVGERELPFASAQAALDAGASEMRALGWVLCPTTDEGLPVPTPRDELLAKVYAAVDLVSRCPDGSDRIHLAVQGAGLREDVARADEETLRRYLAELAALTPAEGERALCLYCEPGEDCTRCGGTGLAVPCPRCGGEGTISWGQGEDVGEGPCPRCSGGVDPEGDYDDPRWEQP
jgi:hypothetical protein